MCCDSQGHKESDTTEQLIRRMTDTIFMGLGYRGEREKEMGLVRGLRELQNQLSDQISRSVMSDSLRPHESQHARPPCPSPTPGVHSDSHPSSQ